MQPNERIRSSQSLLWMVATATWYLQALMSRSGPQGKVVPLTIIDDVKAADLKVSVSGCTCVYACQIPNMVCT